MEQGDTPVFLALTELDGRRGFVVLEEGFGVTEAQTGWDDIDTRVRLLTARRRVRPAAGPDAMAGPFGSIPEALLVRMADRLGKRAVHGV